MEKAGTYNEAVVSMGFVEKAKLSAAPRPGAAASEGFPDASTESETGLPVN